MLKLLFFAALFYFAWKLVKFANFLSNKTGSTKSDEKDPYHKFDIKDADFEDIKEKE